MTIARDRLLDLSRFLDAVRATGFAGTPLVAHALTTTGHTDDAYGLLLETGMPSFLATVSISVMTASRRGGSSAARTRVVAKTSLGSVLSCGTMGSEVLIMN